jgi:hypothetical protein
VALTEPDANDLTAVKGRIEIPQPRCLLPCRRSVLSLVGSGQPQLLQLLRSAQEGNGPPGIVV